MRHFHELDLNDNFSAEDKCIEILDIRGEGSLKFSPTGEKMLRSVSVFGVSDDGFVVELKRFDCFFGCFG